MPGFLPAHGISRGSDSLLRLDRADCHRCRRNVHGPLTFTDELSATVWCLTERHNLVAVVGIAAEHGHHHAYLLPHTTLDLFRRYGFFSDDVKSTLEIAASHCAPTRGDLSTWRVRHSLISVIST